MARAKAGEVFASKGSIDKAAEFMKSVSPETPAQEVQSGWNNLSGEAQRLIEILERDEGILTVTDGTRVLDPSSVLDS